MVPATVILVVLCLAPDVSADVYYRMLFERAVFLLETRIRPLDAVPIFQEIIGRHGDDRYYAARSQLYIGLCYKKAGSGQALQAFREVVKNYPEQTAATGIAESELRGLRVETAKSGRRPEEAAARLVRRFEEGQKIGGLSVDGRYVALVEMETDGLMIYDRAKREARRLDRSRLAGPASGSAEQVTISPDGALVVYSWRHGSGEIELRSIRVDGTGAKTLLSDPSIIGIHPVSWGPAGDRILAVLSGAGAATRVAFIAASDGSIEPVLDLGTRWPGRVLLSPDGRLLAYSLSDDAMIPGRRSFPLQHRREEGGSAGPTGRPRAALSLDAGRQRSRLRRRWIRGGGHLAHGRQQRPPFPSRQMDRRRDRSHRSDPPDPGRLILLQCRFGK